MFQDHRHRTRLVVAVDQRRTQELRQLFAVRNELFQVCEIAGHFVEAFCLVRELVQCEPVPFRDIADNTCICRHCATAPLELVFACAISCNRLISIDIFRLPLNGKRPANEAGAW